MQRRIFVHPTLGSRKGALVPGSAGGNAGGGGTKASKLLEEGAFVESTMEGRKKKTNPTARKKAKLD